MNFSSVRIASIPAIAIAVALGCVSAAQALAVRSGFDANTFAGNDDGTLGPIELGFNVDFFGVESTSVFINNNGNVTFDSQLTNYTPFDLTSTGRQIIAPFFADVDTRYSGSAATYGTGTVDGHQAFAVNWIDVQGFDLTGETNAFQLVLIDRSDTGAGNFDIEFNYDMVSWDSGGFEPGPARVGFSNGTGEAGTFFELPGSATSGAFLDGGLSALVSGSLNSGVDGRYVFAARSGDVEVAPAVPLPATAPLLAGAFGGLALLRRKLRRA